jgi:hypothetical protein
VNASGSVNVTLIFLPTSTLWVPASAPKAILSWLTLDLFWHPCNSYTQLQWTIIILIWELNTIKHCQIKSILYQPQTRMQKLVYQLQSLHVPATPAWLSYSFAKFIQWQPTLYTMQSKARKPPAASPILAPTTKPHSQSPESTRFWGDWWFWGALSYYNYILFIPRLPLYHYWGGTNVLHQPCLK